MLYSTIIQIDLKAILAGEEGIHQENFFIIPFFETAIAEQLWVILDDEWHDVVLRTILEEDLTTHTAIFVLKRKNAFNCRIGGHEELNGLRRQCIEVVGVFNHTFYVPRIICKTNGVGLKNVPGLVVGKRLFPYVLSYKLY